MYTKFISVILLLFFFISGCIATPLSNFSIPQEQDGSVIYSNQVKEICWNGIDDDSDGFTDCASPVCSNELMCTHKNENCNNKIDDDNDGKIDCEDAFCLTAPLCVPVSN